LDVTEEIEVLFVEDNPEDAELTLATLRKSRFVNRIHHVEDGAAALEFLFGDGTRPGRGARLILLDLKLPKVDGLEVLTRLKGDARTRGIPVVVLTSSREDRDLEEAYRLGVNSYIVKPVAFDRFSDAVQQLGLYWLLVNKTPGVEDRSR
jgi:CheY-like chemotaxis protein